MQRPRTTRALQDAACTALAGGVPLICYLATLAPTVYGLDSAELSAGAYCLGIVHAPGSPTYLLLGHLFSLLPLGDVGYRLNLLSAVAAALAALLLYRAITRLTGERALSLAATWFAAFSYYFWVSAVAAELYAVHAVFVSGFLLLALRWRDEGQPSALWLLALSFGIGAGNHLSTVLLLPGLLWLVATGRRSPFVPPALPLLATAAGLLGTTVYLYLPLRYASDAPLNYARDYWNQDLTTASGLRWMITARMFESRLFAVPLADLPGELLVYAGRLWSNFVGPAALLGIAGLIVDARRRPSLHIGLALLFASHLAFYLAYDVGDKEMMLLPTYVIWAVWVALGARAVCARMRELLPPAWAVPAPTLLAFLAAGTVWVNWSRVDLSDDWSARRRGEQILAALAPDAAYLGAWGDAPILEYLQVVESRRPDVRTVNVLFVGESAPFMAASMLRAGRPVYTSQETLVESGEFDVSVDDSCACYRLYPARRPQLARSDGPVCWTMPTR